MAITAQQVEVALAQFEPHAEYLLNGLALLAERANGELSAWGPEGHEVTLERVIPFYGDPAVLRWAFWCETCHVSQLALLARPEGEEWSRRGFIATERDRPQCPRLDAGRYGRDHPQRQRPPTSERCCVVHCLVMVP